MGIIIIVLLLVNLAVSLYINSKIPPKDYINEALERDKRNKDKA